MSIIYVPRAFGGTLIITVSDSGTFTPPADPGVNKDIVLYPLRAVAGYAGVGVGPKVGQPADTIGGPRQ